MPRVKNSDHSIIEALHRLVFENPIIRGSIEAGFDEARTILDGPEYPLPYSSCNVPISTIHEALSPEHCNSVGLCRVFILRAGQKMSPPEIHRNSVQRLVSYSGRGSIHSASPGGDDMNFTEFALDSHDSCRSSEATDFWDIVPENTWHYPEAATESDWYTVTFHSATEDTIIDERWRGDT